jgi:hypothetical protein
MDKIIPLLIFKLLSYFVIGIQQYWESGYEFYRSYKFLN